MIAREITIAVTALRGDIINANHREHWAPRATRVAYWRHAAHRAAREARVPLLSACTVRVTVHLGYRARLKDATNAAPTVKACIDGIVQAGLLLDDSDAYVHAVTFAPTQRIPPSPTVKKPVTYLELRFTEVTTDTDPETTP